VDLTFRNISPLHSKAFADERSMCPDRLLGQNPAFFPPSLPRFASFDLFFSRSCFLPLLIEGFSFPREAASVSDKQPFPLIFFFCSIPSFFVFVLLSPSLRRKEFSSEILAFFTMKDYDRPPGISIRGLPEQFPCILESPFLFDFSSLTLYPYSFLVFPFFLFFDNADEFGRRNKDVFKLTSMSPLVVLYSLSEYFLPSYPNVNPFF